MRSSQIFIDMTSGDPELSRYQAARLRNHGIDFVDAPVSGGPQGAIRGEIAIMVGADESLYKKVYPTLNRISENIFLAGPVGTGHALKAGNNLLNLICRLASFEVVSLMVNEGIDPRCAVEILQKSSGRNYATEITLPDNILSGKMRQGFSMALMQKDASLAIDMARKHDQNMSLGELAVSNLREISVEYGESSDMSKLALYFEKKTRARIRP